MAVSRCFDQFAAYRAALAIHAVNMPPPSPLAPMGQPKRRSAL